MNKIYFTADLHFGHSNILKHSPKRPFSDTVDIVAHDEWLLDLWKCTVDKRDTVYILGDLTFLKSENTRHLLEKLPGQKFLIEETTMVRFERTRTISRRSIRLRRCASSLLWHRS